MVVQVDGRTLAGDYSQAIGGIFDIAQDYKKNKLNQEVLGLVDEVMSDGVLDAKELITLSQKDPNAAQALFKLDQQKKTEQLAQAQQKNAYNFNEASSLLSMNYDERRNAIIDLATQKQESGEDIGRYIELANMTEDQQIARLKNIQIKSGDFDKLFKSGLIGQPKDDRTKERKLFDEIQADESGEFGQFVDRNNQSKATKITNNVGGSLPFKIPNGFMLKDPSDPSQGVTPIPGANTDKANAGDAGKIQMLRTAQKAYADVESIIFDENGSLNEVNLATAWVNFPKSKGRSINQKMEVGIQAITRLETGAAMPPEEVKNTRKRFQPVLGDSTEQAQAKLDLFKDFINGTVKLIDPSGRFNEDRFQTELDKKVKGLTTESGDSNTLSDDELKKKYGIE